MVMNTYRKVIVVLALSGPVPVLIRKARGSSAAMRARPDVFNNPQPPLDELDQKATALESKETAVQQTHSRQATKERNLARDDLKTTYEHVGHYVQTVADAAGDPAVAAQIVVAAAMQIKKSSGHSKADASMRQGNESGTVHAEVRAPRGRTAYRWQTSTDGGKTWVEAGITVKAKTTFAGITPGTELWMRCQPITKDGPRDWLGPVSIIVK